MRDKLVTVPDQPVVVREEPFRRKRVRVFQLPESARNEAGGFALENLRSDDSNELLIGIRPPSHIYLNVGRTRFDGDIFRPLSVKERDSVFSGIVIRFVGVPVKSIHAIRAQARGASGSRATHAHLRELRLSSHRASGQPRDRRPRRHAALPAEPRPSHPHDPEDHRARRPKSLGGQVDTQIYTSDSRPLEATLAEMRRAEIRIAKDHLRMITVDACRGAIAAVRKLASRLRTGAE